MSVNKEVVEKIRTRFLEMVKNNGDRFHCADVEKVKQNDWWIERFVLGTKTEETALKMLVKALEWRKSFGVNDFTEEYFPEEVYKIGLYNVNFNDKEDRQLVWARIGRYHKSELSPLIKKYLVYWFEKLDRKNSHGGWAGIIDSTGAGLSTIDIDFCFFIVEVIQNYYPCGMKYLCVVDLPWVLNAAAKLVLSFMNEETRNSVKFIKSEELSQYMNSEQIPVHLKGTYDKDMIFVPKGSKRLEELTHTHYHPDQIKNIRLAYKTELK